VAEQQKKVSAIESKLFSFAGGATKAIPFKDAYAYAQEASGATGVRPALILAILTQESNLGSNVGTCNRAGDPPSKSYTAVMHPTRDIPVFLRITKALGLNPDTTPVSCRVGNVGYGGAMGPAQFIPSTWVMYEGKVAAALGKSTANPWVARDAIMASAMLMKANGATGSEAAERNAACRYYSGRSCDGKKPANSFYGNSVMALARTIQADIDYLVQYGVSRR
jgi:membrane-bound lytic murein transglycosylase B